VTGPRHLPVDYVRPGPPTIDPDRCPDGVVIHVYAVPTERLLLVRYALATDPLTTDQIEADAEDAEMALRADEHGFCLVAYDGDTGRRFSPWEI
jgi:hypothetical protein